MQAGTPEQYEAEAEYFDRLAEKREQQGWTYLARQYRETAKHNRECAEKARNN